MDNTELLAEIAGIHKRLCDLTIACKTFWHLYAGDYESKFMDIPDIYDKSIKHSYYLRGEKCIYYHDQLRALEPPSDLSEIKAYKIKMQELLGQLVPPGLREYKAVKEINALHKKLNSLVN